jgi:Ca-activated chloride channel family protein
MALVNYSAFAEDQGVQSNGSVARVDISNQGIATDINVEINGMLAKTKVTQLFVNNTSHWQEGIYTWPLPENATVEKLTMIVDDRKIIGFIAKKEDAKKLYEKAKQEGQAASLLEQHKENIFRTSVANIPPEAFFAVEVQYSHEIELADHVFSLRLPLAITPRFDNFSTSDMKQLLSKNSESTNIISQRLRLLNFKGGKNEVALNVILNPEFEIKKPVSSTHQIAVNELDKKIHITTQREIIPGKQDFIISWEPKFQDMPIAFMQKEVVENEVYSQLVVIPPSHDYMADKKANVKRQITMIIDISGSMSGPSIRQAKSALSKAVTDLSSDDYFNVIAFQSFTKKLFQFGSRKADEVNIRKAQEWINELEAGGGTVMGPSLKMALEEKHKEGHLRQIIFITDGAIGYEDSVAHFVKNNVGNARFFVVGIGSAPNTHLMKLLALHGRGVPVFIGNIEETEHEMNSLFQKMRSPILTDLKLNLSDDIRAEIIPSKVPDLIKGEAIKLAIKSTQDLNELTLTGLKAGKPWAYNIALDKSVNIEGVSKLWGRRKIQDIKFNNIQDYKNGEIKDTITTIAIKHQIMSDFTSLVAIDERQLRPYGVSIHTKHYDPNLPQGWQLAEYDPAEVANAYEQMLQDQNHNDTPKDQVIKNLQLPQTATNWQIGIVLGILILMLGAQIFYYGRKSYAH